MSYGVSKCMPYIHNVRSARTFCDVILKIFRYPQYNNIYKNTPRGRGVLLKICIQASGQPFCFIRLITLSLVNSSRSFSSKALEISFVRVSYLGMVIFFRALARF